MMAVARTLIEYGSIDRALYLFDTFDGMTEPTATDENLWGGLASDLLKKSDKLTAQVWAHSSLAEVSGSMRDTGYGTDKIFLVKGRVEETLPAKAPDAIALLRLDTDWYESIYHELVHLYPRLSVGGVLLIDDYGHWKGAKRAVDQYIKENNVKILLNRIDYTGRIGVKLKP